MNSKKNTARMAGWFYLMMIITLIVAVVILSKIIVSGDAMNSAKNIVVSEWSFRLAAVSEMLSAAFFLLAGWALYVLLKPVNRHLALLFLLLNLGGGIILCMDTLNLFAALLLVSGTDYLHAFQTDQRQSLAMVFLKLHNDGFMITEIFYGTWLFPMGYLVYKSGFLPKILGILLMIDCFCVLIWFLQFFLFPSYKTIAYPCQVESFIAELSFTLWLLIKGVRDER